jgi:hypothetical protein
MEITNYLSVETHLGKIMALLNYTINTSKYRTRLAGGFKNL